MSSISPRDAILSIAIVPAALAASSSVDAKLDSKVQEIATLLQDNPALLKDDEVMARVMDFTKESQEPGIRTQRAKWIEKACVDREKGIVKVDFKSYVPDQERAEITRNCSEEQGQFDVQSKSLTFSVEALKKINETDLWDFIQKEGVKKLVIRQADGQSTEYGEFILGLLCEKRPAPASFLENVTLVIEEMEIEIPKAKVLLCGEYFVAKLSGRIGASNRIDFTEEDPVTLDIFNGILSHIETGQKSADLDEEDYGFVIDFLQFTPPLPKGCLGAVLFEKLGHKLTEFTPQQWKEWIQAIEDMKTDIPDGVIFGIDPGLSIDAMEAIIQDPSNGNVTKLRYYDPAVKTKLGAASSNPCLFVRAKSVLEGTRDKSYADQLKVLEDLSKQSGHLYEPPTTREVVASECLHFIKTGERLLVDNPRTYTRTSDQVTVYGINYQTVVGGFLPNGLGVGYRVFVNDYGLGLSPSRKFYRL